MFCWLWSLVKHGDIQISAESKVSDISMIKVPALLPLTVNIWRSACYFLAKLPLAVFHFYKRHISAPLTPVRTKEEKGIPPKRWKNLNALYTRGARDPRSGSTTEVLRQLVGRAYVSSWTTRLISVRSTRPRGFEPLIIISFIFFFPNFSVCNLNSKRFFHANEFYYFFSE